MLKTLKKRIVRASIRQLLPIVAFSAGLIIATAVVSSQIFVSYSVQHAQTDAFAKNLAASLSGPLAAENVEEVSARLEDIAPGKSRVLTVDGQSIGAAFDVYAERQTSRMPIIANGETVGTLVYAPLRPYRSVPSFGLAAFVVISSASLAALIMHLLASTVAGYVEQLTAIVKDFSLRGSDDFKKSELKFAEFRRLDLATKRTTRRVVRELRDLQKTVQIDPRTGLFNEGSLNGRMEKAVVKCSFSSPAAYLLIEFNGYADKVDRIQSEQLLRLLSKTLKITVRECESARGLERGSWTVAALPSDRFAIVATEIGHRDEMAAIVREIQARFRDPIKLGERPVTVNLQGSIVMVPEDGDAVAQIKQRADDTLRDHQRQNKPGFAFYSPKLERQREAQHKLEDELRTAVEEKRFIPLFQPKIDLRTGRVMSVEALARWRLENGRLVSPSVFIELAEETGLISEIGEQILNLACEEAAKWNREGHPISLAVNVSPKQFEKDSLSITILDAIATSGLPPRKLQIEITESLAIAHPKRVRDVLAPLRKLGIELAIDDFGTGHSNLATLTQLDFDVFKIDRQFVSGVPDDRQANAVVDMILGMANTLEMQIVGEGIETEQQASFLRDRGCHIGQGFLYSPPIPAEDLTKMLNEQPFMPQRRRA